MKKLSHLIEKRLHQHKLGDSAKASHIVHLANQLLKEKYGMAETELKALTLKDGVLKIGVVSSVWSQELIGYQDTLLKQIQKEYGQKSVMKIMITSLALSD